VPAVAGSASFPPQLARISDSSTMITTRIFYPFLFL
jgi:hypothetical protein